MFVEKGTSEMLPVNRIKFGHVEHKNLELKSESFQIRVLNFHR